MKRVFLLLTLATLLTCPAFGQRDDSTNAPGRTPPSGGPPPGGGRPGALTKEESQELKTARENALKANPDLAAEDKDLMDKMAAHHKALNAAMIAVDPNVAPLIAKADAAHLHRGGGDAPPSPPRDNTPTPARTSPTPPPPPPAPTTTTAPTATTVPSKSSAAPTPPAPPSND